HSCRRKPSGRRGHTRGYALRRICRTRGSGRRVGSERAGLRTTKARASHERLVGERPGIVTKLEVLEGNAISLRLSAQPSCRLAIPSFEQRKPDHETTASTDARLDFLY